MTCCRTASEPSSMETAVVGLPGPRPAREEPLAGASGGSARTWAEFDVPGDLLSALKRWLGMGDGRVKLIRSSKRKGRA